VKPGLTFYTNMPTPYQLDFFEALKTRFSLTVVYFTAKENDRVWDLKVEGKGYTTVLLDNSPVLDGLRKFMPSVHYSSDLVSYAKSDPNPFAIVNGTYWSPNVVLALKTLFRAGKKTAFWGEAIFAVSNAVKRSLKKLMFRPIRKYATCVMAIGDAAARRYREYGFTRKIFNVPYSINIELFNEATLEKNALENLTRQYRSEDEVIFLSSGSLIRRKGMDTVIKAFRRFPPGLKSKLLIVGEGEEKPNLEKLAEGDPRIHFLGFRTKEELPYLFNLADVFVFGSRYDGWGLVINEAVAARCAVISTNQVGSVNDLLEDRKDALVCDADDDLAMFNAMNKMMDAGWRNSIQQTAWSKRHRFSSEYQANMVFTIFMEDLKDNPL